MYGSARAGTHARHTTSPRSVPRRQASIQAPARGCGRKQTSNQPNTKVYLRQLSTTQQAADTAHKSNANRHTGVESAPRAPLGSRRRRRTRRRCTQERSLRPRGRAAAGSTACSGTSDTSWCCARNRARGCVSVPAPLSHPGRRGRRHPRTPEPLTTRSTAEEPPASPPGRSRPRRRLPPRCQLAGRSRRTGWVRPRPTSGPACATWLFGHVTTSTHVPSRSAEDSGGKPLLVDSRTLCRGEVCHIRCSFNITSAPRCESLSLSHLR